MKKVLLTVFIAASFLVCLLPSVGMIFRPTAEPVGNERQTPLPSLTDEQGGFNTAYPAQLGNYFSKHFAFRPEAISADAQIQANVFRVADNDSVVVGTDGWLYYSSTVDDYLGKDTFSPRETASLIHNLEIIKTYSEAHGAQFLFTIAPNKNTLYPEHMPYYYGKAVSDIHNRDFVTAALAESDIPYCDLFALFESREETLYFARDSHWNNEGALLAYDAMLTQLGKGHDDYSSAPSERRKDFTGDLAAMLYPAGSEPEYNTYYGAEERYRYVTETASVEDSFIRTESGETGSLYMYRDSFGNALLPFFAAGYGNATFTKSFPMILKNDFETVGPDTFVLELVERNLDWLITRPPVLDAPSLSYYNSEGTLKGKAETAVKPCEYAPAYTEISGTVSQAALRDDAVFYVEITGSDGKTAAYEAFSLSTDESDCAFAAYLPADAYPADAEWKIGVIVKNGDDYYEIGGLS